MKLHENYYIEKARQEELLSRKNNINASFYNGIFERFENPVLTREHVPIEWRYDLNPETNPYFEERLGINAVMNPGAIYLDKKYYLMARVEGADRKSFFALAFTKIDYIVDYIKTHSVVRESDTEIGIR